MNDFYGVVQAGIPAGRSLGWYNVAPIMGSPVLIQGTSIKRTSLTAGQPVDIITCGSEKNAEYGFIERTFSLGSAFLQDGAGKSQAIASAPFGASMAWLLNQAGRAKNRFRPGTVTAIGGISLTITDRYSGESITLPVSPDLTPAMFSVGDTILIGVSPRHEVVGWWLMVPGWTCFTASSPFDSTGAWLFNPTTNVFSNGVGVPFTILATPALVHQFPVSIGAKLWFEASIVVDGFGAQTMTMTGSFSSGGTPESTFVLEFPNDQPPTGPRKIYCTREQAPAVGYSSVPFVSGETLFGASIGDRTMAVLFQGSFNASQLFQAITSGPFTTYRVMGVG